MFEFGNDVIAFVVRRHLFVLVKFRNVLLPAYEYTK
jgi:hypothetical protein